MFSKNYIYVISIVNFISVDSIYMNLLYRQEYSLGITIFIVTNTILYLPQVHWGYHQTLI